MEWLTEGLMVTILGFSTVFVVLIFISLILSLFGVIANKPAEQKTDTKTVKNTVPVAEKTTVENKGDDMELIAVITAAIAASEKAKGNNISPDKLVVRSLRRVNAWNKEAMYEQHNIFFN